MTETDLPETSNAESSAFICMIQLPPYRLHKLGIVLVPRWIPANTTMRSEKYHQIQSYEIYFSNIMRTKVLKNHPNK